MNSSRLLKFAAVLLFISAVNARDMKTKNMVISDTSKTGQVIKEAGGVIISTASKEIHVDSTRPIKSIAPISSSDSLNKSSAGNAIDTVYLKTSPDDAYVYAKDSLVGHTPLFVSQSLGKIKLSKPGYDSKELDLSSYKNEKVNLTYTGKEAQESFFKTNAFKILIGSLTALGAATAYFKIKADKKFTDYQSSGDRKLLDETHKYDLISGIAFGALQVNFGFLIYYFLKD